jgi:hypothetical protein
MTEILLALIALGVFIVAFALFRVANGLLFLAQTHSERQQEISEALWAKMGFTREEWRKVRSDARLAEHEEKSWREFEQKQRREST